MALSSPTTVNRPFLHLTSTNPPISFYCSFSLISSSSVSCNRKKQFPLPPISLDNSCISYFPQATQEDSSGDDVASPTNNARPGADSPSLGIREPIYMVVEVRSDGMISTRKINRRRLLKSSGRWSNDQEEYHHTTESGQESPPPSFLRDTKIASTYSPKRSKRGMQKRVVSVPMKDVEGSRVNGDKSTPPSDSWAWRKYGQKPIKGSPYPRGYYRCSSSKGCPARKQVERSKVDPTILMVTYACEHNHPWPLSRRTSHKPNPNTITRQRIVYNPETQENNREEDECHYDLIRLDESSVPLGDKFGWFGGMETAPCGMLESPIYSDTTARRKSASTSEDDVSVFLPMREEDESLFADLGELPECTAVFRVGPQVQIC